MINIRPSGGRSYAICFAVSVRWWCSRSRSRSSSEKDAGDEGGISGSSELELTGSPDSMSHTLVTAMLTSNEGPTLPAAEKTQPLLSLDKTVFNFSINSMVDPFMILSLTPARRVRSSELRQLTSTLTAHRIYFA